MKIVVLDGRGLNPGDLSYACLEEFGSVTVYQHTDTPAQAIARIGSSEIVLVNKVPITREILDACPSIRLICVLATGYNVVDCQACAQRGIPVTNVPAYGTAAVAQFTMALILELCHRVGLHNHSVHQGDWCRSETFCYWLTPQMELAGKTLGIIGYGRIGQAAGALARAFGMEVLAYHPRRNLSGEPYVELDTLLERSDILSLHCPLFPETQHLINRETIAKMKDGAMLINTARGALVEESALAQALNAGKLRGAAVDVVSQEPMAPDNPLLSCKNCIITPHIAWAPVESRQRLLNCVVENIRSYLAGHPQNVVNG